MEIHVSTGSAEISGEHIDSVQVTIERGGDQKWRNEHVRIDRNRNPVLVDIDDLPQFAQVRILVPEAAGIAVSTGAGELKIRGVHGDQLALLRAGEMTIDVGEPKDYRAARAFVLSGEVQAPAFDTTTGGLWRMRTWKGPGQRVLDAQVTTGHLVLQ